MATMKAVAERAQVSIPVVSAFLSGSKTVRMSAETRERVAAAIKELGYVPNLAARSLRTLRSNVVAVIIPKLQNPVYAEMLEGIYQATEEHGLVVMLGDTAGVKSGGELLNHVVAQGTVDGLIIRRSASLSPEIITRLTNRKLPVLYLDNESQTRNKWLSIDDQRGVQCATEHLLDLGHRRIAVLGGSYEDAVAEFTRRRLAGYTDAMSQRGLPEIAPILGGQSMDEGYDQFRSYFAPARRAGRPTGLVINNSTTALGALAAAADLGIAVPEELSIIGYHEIPMAPIIRPRLTTVRMPMRELGYQGVQIFTRMVNGERVRSHVLTSTAPEVIIRESTARPRRR